MCIRDSAHLDGVEYTGRGERRECVNGRIYDIGGISAIGIAPGERGKTRRRADGIARIEIRELRALFADAVDVRGIIYLSLIHIWHIIVYVLVLLFHFVIPSLIFYFLWP